MNCGRKGFRGRGALGVLVGRMYGGGSSEGTPACAGSVIPVSGSATGRHGIQLGIDVDAYTYKGQDIPSRGDGVREVCAQPARERDLDHVPVLHEWPECSGRDAPGTTPTPHQMATFTRIAEAHGLFVAFRPLLDETSIDHEFRGNMQPRTQPSGSRPTGGSCCPMRKRRSARGHRSSS